MDVSSLRSPPGENADLCPPFANGMSAPLASVRRMDIEAPAVSFGIQFPALQTIGEVALDSAVVRAVVVTHTDQLSLDRLVTRGVMTIADMAALSAQEVSDWRGYGVTKVAHLRRLAALLAIESESIRSMNVAMQHTADVDFEFGSDRGAGRSVEDADRAPGGLQLALDPSGLPEQGALLSERHLVPPILTEWASVVHGATKLGEVFAHLREDTLPEDVAHAWNELLSEGVQSIEPPDLVGMLLDLGVHDARVLDVLERRVLASDPMTLDQLGQVHGVSRERVRQLERSAIEALKASYRDHADLRGMRWLGRRLRERLGAIAPSEAPAEILPSSDLLTRRFLLLCEGYEEKAGLVLRSGAKLPAFHEIPFVDLADQIVDLGELVPHLVAKGVLEEQMDAVLGKVPGLVWQDDALVRRPGSIVDRAYVVLYLHGEPMEIADLHSAACPEKNIAGFRDRVFNDARMARVGKREVALVDWGLPEYGGVVDAMLKACGEDEWALDDLALELSVRYGVSDASVRMCAAAPVFRVADGYIELRPENDPYVPRHRPEQVPNLYASGDLLVWNIKVDREAVRGSGRPLPSEVATAMGVQPGDKRVVDVEGVSISISWPLTSHTGPSHGSLTRLLETLNAAEGEWLQLVFSPEDNYATARRLSVDGLDPEALIRTWCNLRERTVDLREQLSDALFGGPVFAVLKKRGETFLTAAALDVFTSSAEGDH